jgi:hypothetical protein
MDIVEIDGVKLRLSHPGRINMKWIGYDESVTPIDCSLDHFK